MAVKAALSLSKLSRVPAGNFSKAASVGANTVKGPSPFNVASKPVAANAACRVLNDKRFGFLNWKVSEIVAIDNELLDTVVIRAGMTLNAIQLAKKDKTKAIENFIFSRVVV